MSDDAILPVRIKMPTLDDLDGYAAALRRGWSPTTTEDISQRELEKLEASPRRLSRPLSWRRAAQFRCPTGKALHASQIGSSSSTTANSAAESICASSPAPPIYPTMCRAISDTLWCIGRTAAATPPKRYAYILPVARELGLPFVTITCDSDNYASRRVIEKNGGVLVGEQQDNFLKDVIKLVWRVEV